MLLDGWVRHSPSSPPTVEKSTGKTCQLFTCKFQTSRVFESTDQQPLTLYSSYIPSSLAVSMPDCITEKITGSLMTCDTFVADEPRPAISDNATGSISSVGSSPFVTHCMTRGKLWGCYANKQVPFITKNETNAHSV